MSHEINQTEILWAFDVTFIPRLDPESVIVARRLEPRTARLEDVISHPIREAAPSPSRDPVACAPPPDVSECVLFMRVDGSEARDNRPGEPTSSRTEGDVVGRTDFPANPFASGAFDELRNAASAAEYERLNKPYAPLPPSETAPTMSQLWAYAHRRYGRYQGYAWGGVLLTGALAYVASGSSSLIRGDDRGGRSEHATPSRRSGE